MHKQFKLGGTWNLSRWQTAEPSDDVVLISHTPNELQAMISELCTASQSGPNAEPKEDSGNEQSAKSYTIC